MIEFSRKLLNATENVLTYSAIVTTSIMMCLITADSLARYVFNSSIVGVYEITEKYLMVGAAFLGICYAYRGGSHIRVTFLIDRFPPKPKMAVNYFVQVFSILIGTLYVVATAKKALHTIADGITLGVVTFPMGPACLIPAVGLFFMSLLMLLDLPRVKAGKSDLFKEESPTDLSK